MPRLDLDDLKSVALWTLAGNVIMWTAVTLNLFVDLF